MVAGITFRLYIKIILNGSEAVIITCRLFQLLATGCDNKVPGLFINRLIISTTSSEILRPGSSTLVILRITLSFSEYHGILRIPC